MENWLENAKRTGDWPQADIDRLGRLARKESKMKSDLYIDVCIGREQEFALGHCAFVIRELPGGDPRDKREL